MASLRIFHAAEILNYVLVLAEGAAVHIYSHGADIRLIFFGLSVVIEDVRVGVSSLLGERGRYVLQ